MNKVKTRSVHIANKYNGLRDYFKTTESDTHAFVNTLDGIIQKEGGGSHKEDVIHKLVSGKVDRVSSPKKLAMQLSGFVRIFYGKHNDDYVWHIEHANIKRPWKVSESRVIYIIAKIMSEHLPPNIEAKIWRPQPDWELRTITFKALDLVKQWNFEEKMVSDINGKLFEILNTVV